MKNKRSLIFVVAIIAVLAALMMVNRPQPETPADSGTLAQPSGAQPSGAQPSEPAGTPDESSAISDANAKGMKIPLLQKALVDDAPLDSDFTMGNPDAPIIMIEYASLSCPHCAHFSNDVFPRLKEQYINTGKVLYILRQFPLNEPAFKAAMLVTCVGEEEGAERYYTFNKALFDGQSKWAFEQDYVNALKTFATVGGIPEAAFDKCLRSVEREKHLLTHKKAAIEELNVDRTPIFFINGTAYRESFSVESMSAYLDSLLAESQK